MLILDTNLTRLYCRFHPLTVTDKLVCEKNMDRSIFKTEKEIFTWSLPK